MFREGIGKNESGLASKKREVIDDIKKGNGIPSEEELDMLRQACPEGITLWDIIEIVESRISGELSEATFRKYVQSGLVCGCMKHVGQKGRNRGSQGLYPVITVQQVCRAKEFLSGDEITKEDLMNNISYIGQRDIATARETIRRLMLKIDMLEKASGFQLEAKGLLEDAREKLRVASERLDEDFQNSLEKD